jgi:hypothetical protein
MSHRGPPDWDRDALLGQDVEAMMDDPERVKKEVRDLLVRGASRKLQRWGTEDARVTFERAHALCKRTALPQPWPALVAYRLAHLELRRAKEDEALRKVDALFVEAARAPVIGPWPLIYRLAVLHRLGVDRATIEQAFARALDAHGAWVRSEQRSPLEAEGPHGSTTLQSDAFSLLDLAGMFCAIDRGPLEGLGHASHAEPLIQGTWIVLAGPLGSVADGIVMPESYARAELDSRLERHPGLGAVIHDGGGRAWWRLPGAASFEPLADAYARLLLLLLGGLDSRTTLVSMLHEGSDGDPDASFRQTCARLATKLRAAGFAVGRGQDFIEEHRGTRVRLRTDLPFVGACPKALLSSPRAR